MGSYGSSLRCQTCPTGFLSPPDWKCDGKCQKSMPKEKAEKILGDANKKGFHHLWKSDAFAFWITWLLVKSQDATIFESTLQQDLKGKF